METFDIGYWLWLSLIFEPGSGACDSLLYSFGDDPKAIYEADEGAISQFAGDNFRLRGALLDKRLDRVYSLMEYCQRENIGILTPDSRLYPSSLLRIIGRPPVLYYKGRLPDFSGKLFIGVVGTRNVTPYGSSAAYTVSHDLASAGAVVVSGMALGSDTAAHRGALDASGHTVAFLGCGIDVVYPKENAGLMQEIISTGTVMTDYAPGSRPEGRHFPARNRLISGISSGVLVTEASEKSGALITAEHARKQGKLVYAIPGKVGELASLGTNRLIANGAKMVTGAEDILRDFKEVYPALRMPEYPRTSNIRAPRAYPHKNGYEPDRAPEYTVKLTNDPNPEPPAPWENRSETTKNVPVNEAKQGVREISGKFPETAGVRNVKEKAAQPRPVILYGEEAEARSYMSMDDSPSVLPKLPEYPYDGGKRLIYPNDSVPDGGYEVKVCSEGQKRYEEITETTEMMSFPIKFQPPKEPSSPKPEAEKKAEKKDFSALSENERLIAEFLLENGKSTADRITETGLSVSKALAALTMLEIKRVVTQLPGGFFELI